MWCSNVVPRLPLAHLGAGLGATEGKGKFPLRKISTEGKFCKMWLANTDFPSEKNFEVENFELLTMIFAENILSVEMFLECKWALTCVAGPR
jgi:hypothetical protein